jgi:probable rRNA maturation factor
MEPGESTPTILVRAPGRVTRAVKRGLETFACELSLQLAGGRVFTCLLAGDRTLQRLNREYLGHDHATDVLSFPSTGGNFLGDLAISIDRAEAQAREFNHALLDELRILRLHGVLHLLGYDHATDRGKMARAEQKWRGVFQLPCGLIERARSLEGVTQ